MRYRFVAVDLIRSLASYLVLAVHLGGAGIIRGSDRFQWLARNGAYGVTIFFVLSGFLITHSTANREEKQGNSLFELSVREFYIRRIARVLPLFCAAIALGLILLILPRSAATYFCLDFDPLYLGAIATLTSNWLSVANDLFLGSFGKGWHVGLHWGTFWSLAVEEQFYLAFPLLLTWAGSLRKLNSVLLTLIPLGVAMRAIAYYLAPNSYSVAICNSFTGFELISMGVLLHFISEEEMKLKTAWMATGLGAFLMWACYDSALLQDGLSRIYGPSFMGLGVFIFLAGALNLRFGQHPAIALLSLPGRLSYGLYLLHAIVLYFLWDILSGMSAWIAYPLFCGATTAIAYFSYHYFEEPINRWIRYKLSR